MKGYIKKIDQINFGLMSPEDIRTMSVVTVETPDTYEDDGFPIEKGLMDPRLGVIDPSLVCRTCGLRGGECQGHFGSIELARPVIHIGFGDVIHKMLRSTCNECGRVLLTDEQIEEYTIKIYEAMENKQSITNILRSLFNNTKFYEVKDERQNDIVNRIWDDHFPYDVNELEYEQIAENLMNISKILFTDAYVEGEHAKRTYLEARWLCPHCKKNIPQELVSDTFYNVESKTVQSDIDDIFNFSKLVSEKNTELNKNIDKLINRIKRLSELTNYDLSYFQVQRKIDAYDEFIDGFSNYKNDISGSKDIEYSLSIYNIALRKFNEDIFTKLGIAANEEINRQFVKCVESARVINNKDLKEFIENFKLIGGNYNFLEELAYYYKFNDNNFDLDFLNELHSIVRPNYRVHEIFKKFIGYLEALDDMRSIGDTFLEEFEEDKARLVQNETRNYIQTYLQKMIQEPIKLDFPVTIRQGDYKLVASEVRERLERITDEDSFILGVNPEVARPEWMVLTVLPVPPVTVRPSITLDTGERSEDDLTHKLVDILRINQRLHENMDAGAPQLIVEDLWELLQYHVTTYFDNEAWGVPPARHRSGRPLKTLTQRLKGKEGRFRSNLSGKRVNFSARTVISPDPNISINEVGVPEMIAKEVTVPVHVTDFNIDEIKKYIRNGPNVHPGANYVIRTDGRKIRIRSDETIDLILEQLEPGFIVERHLIDGDMVLFNRQPSLHRMSMMAHEARVLPYKTFRLNPCVCPPYNADFDGDEMNMHVFQTVESRVEAKSLMRVQEHILSPRFGGPIIGAIHDHISGAYLLTRDWSEFTEEQALQIIRKSHLKLPEFHHNHWILKSEIDIKPNKQVPEDIEKSFIYKKKGEMWTGKELFSLLLPNDFNLSYSAEISKSPVVYPAEDATVVIENGILLQGVIDESAFGSFSGKILDKIVKEYGPGRGKEFLDRATDMAICGIMKTGITTSLNDEEIPYEAQDRIHEHLDRKMAEVDKLVESYEEGYLQALPGRSREETLEMKIMQVLGEARDGAGAIAENYLTMGKQYDEDPYNHVNAVENHSVVMARTGARASMLNLIQITACVGQQAVRGGRIKRGYLKRTLPHFRKGELGAKAKGFVHSSYKSGLDPIEFFFHAMGGREGLVDTAIRTALSGYMQRRLVNALQDLQVDFKGVVRDNNGNVIQTMFGDDGVDPVKSDFGKPADLNRLIDEIRLGNTVGEELENIQNQRKINNLKGKIDSLIKDITSFKRKVHGKITDFDEYNLEDNFNSIILNIDSFINFLNDLKDEDDLNKLQKGFNDCKNNFTDIKARFRDEVDRLDDIVLDIKKEEVKSYVKSTENRITLLFVDIDNALNNHGYVKNCFKSLIQEINDLKDGLSDNLKIVLNPVYDEISEFENRLKGISNDLNKMTGAASGMQLDLARLYEYDEINDDLENRLDAADSKIQDIISNLKYQNQEISKSKGKLSNIKSQFEDIKRELNTESKKEKPTGSLADKLREYQELLDDGIITKEEFMELKKQAIFGKR